MQDQIDKESGQNGSEMPVPIVWLFGKVQHGKTSIRSLLTCTDLAGVGEGFVRKTREPKLYAWPPPPLRPIFQFLDTPGIGAEGADNAAEAKTAMVQGEQQAHVLLLAVRAEDRNLDGLMDALREIRGRHSDWPLIVAQTRLHDLYPPNGGHAMPYPYNGDERDDVLPGVPTDLRQSLAAQRATFSRLPGSSPIFIPIDLTRPEQKLSPGSYGAERLLEVLERLLPDVIHRKEVVSSALDSARTQIILPYAIGAAAAEAPPLPGLGLVGASTAQILMLKAIANRFDLQWDRDLFWRFLAILGPGIAASFGAAAMARQVVKLVPVAGTALAATTSFAATWAVGEAAMRVFASFAEGKPPPVQQIRENWHKRFGEGKEWFRANQMDASKS